MRKKVVITHSSILTERWVKYYCLDVLCDKFDLEYWDCSAFTYPCFGGSNELERDYLHKIHSIDDFRNRVEMLPKQALIVNDMHFTSQNYPVHLILSKKFKDIVYINFFANAQNKDSFDISKDTNFSLSRSFHEFVYRITCKNDFLLWLKCCIKRYNEKKVRSLDAAKFKIRTKELYNIHFIDTDISGKRVINLPDYEDMLDVVGKPRIVQDRYIVYVGQYLPYHPEVASNNPDLNIPTIAKNYYLSMNSFFALVEKSTGFKVVIAEHPVSNFRENPYCGREIFIGKTAKLICDSEAVLIHGSGAIDYSMMFNKPTILVHNKYVRAMCNIWNPEQNIAKAMKLPLVDTDLPFDSTVFYSGIEPSIRDKYLMLHFRDFNKQHEKNADLLERYFNELYFEIYRQ